MKLSKIKIEDYKKIKDILEKGGIFIYPTETIYGIGGNALIESVYDRIKKIKQRDDKKNFIWLFKDIDMMRKFTFINAKEEQLIKKYHPGPLTIILKSKIENFDYIACRISPHPFLNKLFELINFPIISTSANISNQQYIHKFDLIYSIFSKKVDVLVEDDIENKDNNALPSTIVKVENNKIIILREGKIKLHP